MPDPRTGLPNTVREWEQARPVRRSQEDVLVSLLNKADAQSVLATPGEGMVPFTALPEVVVKAAAGNYGGKHPIGFRPSDLDPEELALLNRMVQVNERLRAPAKAQAEQEAAAMLASKPATGRQ